MLFVPHYSPQFPGEIWPLLIPGWTLNFEMFFYAVFLVGPVFETGLTAPQSAIVPSRLITPIATVRHPLTVR